MAAYCTTVLVKKKMWKWLVVFVADTLMWMLLELLLSHITVAPDLNVQTKVCLLLDIAIRFILDVISNIIFRNSCSVWLSSFVCLTVWICSQVTKTCMNIRFVLLVFNSPDSDNSYLKYRMIPGFFRRDKSILLKSYSKLENKLVL
jgi:hypothetical protein